MGTKQKQRINRQFSCFSFYQKLRVLANLLENAGFRVKTVYGDFDKRAHNQRSQQTVFVASKS
jgi:hypothetical protein